MKSNKTKMEGSVGTCRSAAGTFCWISLRLRLEEALIQEDNGLTERSQFYLGIRNVAELLELAPLAPYSLANP